MAIDHSSFNQLLDELYGRFFQEFTPRTIDEYTIQNQYKEYSYLRKSYFNRKKVLKDASGNIETYLENYE